jgi:general secretion pathway protein L
MVPKMAVSAALEDLALAGLRPRFLEIGSRLLPLAETDADRASLMLRGLAWTCTGLAVVAVVLPFALQAWALHAANDAIADLQPSIRQVEALRRNITAGGAEREVLAREMARTGDVLDVLATVTHILPDDTFLTDFALRERHLTISGRSTSAPRLISGLTADTGIRDAAFAAPVTRIEGASADVFSISAQIAPTGTP